MARNMRSDLDADLARELANLLLRWSRGAEERDELPMVQEGIAHEPVGAQPERSWARRN